MIKRLYILLFAAVLISGGVYAQNNEKNSSLTKAGENEIAIDWLTTESDPEPFRLLDAAASMTCKIFMEFDMMDLFNFKFSGQKATSIKQLRVHLDPGTRSSISAFSIVIRKGESLSSAVQIYSESIDLNRLTDNWNNIDLSTPRSISLNPGEKLYVGCSVSSTGNNVPLSIVERTNTKRSLIELKIGTQDLGIVSFTGFETKEFLMKAIAGTEEANANEIALESILESVAVSNYIGVAKDSLPVTGTIFNYGRDTLKSFKLSHEIDGVSLDTVVTGLSVAPGQKSQFNYFGQFYLEMKKYHFKITVSEPNGVQDLIFNNTLEADVTAYAAAERKIVLHEVFTSSTCGPCKPGNEALETALKAVDSSKWVCIKYQMNYPDTGDPYYTAEVGTRANFYGGINSVPTLIANGPNVYRDSPQMYSAAALDAMTGWFTPVKITNEKIEINNKTVDFKVTIEPLYNIKKTEADIRFFAAIVEKRTEKNVKTNGETEFHFVMKKFITSVSGLRIDSLEAGKNIPYEGSYTFNGEYRLPANSKSPINSVIENSVECFENLMVVYWLQNNNTKEIYQSGKADPYPGSIVYDEVAAPVNQETAGINIYPNPLRGSTLQVELSLKKSTEGQITIHDMLGKEILKFPANTYTPGKTVSVNISNLSKGVYFVRFNTPEGSALSKGVYFVRFNTPEGSASRKLIIVK